MVAATSQLGCASSGPVPRSDRKVLARGCAFEAHDPRKGFVRARAASHSATEKAIRHEQSMQWQRVDPGNEYLMRLSRSQRLRPGTTHGAIAHGATAHDPEC